MKHPSESILFIVDHETFLKRFSKNIMQHFLLYNQTNAYDGKIDFAAKSNSLKIKTLCGKF